MLLALPKPGPNDALPIYRRLGKAMERMPHNLKHADSNWPSKEPELAVQKRVWMQPFLKDVKLANDRPTLSYADPLSSDFLRLNQLVVGLCHEALWLVGEGKTDAAIQTLDQALDFVARMYTASDRIGAMVTLLLEAIVYDRIRILLRSHPKLAERLAELADKPRPRPNPRSMLLMSPTEVHNNVTYSGDTRLVGRSVTKAPLVSSASLRNPWIRDLVETHLLAHYIAAYHALPKDIADWRTAAPKVMKLEADMASQKSGIGGFAAELYFPISRVLDTIAEQHVGIDVSKLAIRIVARHKNGEPWPSALDADLKARVDPFSGRPFGYQKTPSGFIVYSVGPDGADNGGGPGDVAIAFPPK